MYAKVFTQILDSSIAEDHEVRHTFEDMLKLCDLNGVVDMTVESISRRLNVPIEIIARCIAELEKPDAASRTKEHQGRRIVRIDDHRAWGWFIVNYDYYRNLASEEQRRAKTKLRTQKWRGKVTPCDAPVTLGDAGDAMQREMQREKEKDPTAINNLGEKNGWPTLKETIERGQFIGVTPEECEKFFHHYESMGWVDKNGNPIHKWQSKLAVWKASQQEKAFAAKGNGDSFWKDKARFDMVEKELAAIHARASHTAMDVIIQPQDKENHGRLKKERSELRRKLNLS